MKIRLREQDSAKPLCGHQAKQLSWSSTRGDGLSRTIFDSESVVIPIKTDDHIWLWWMMTILAEIDKNQQPFATTSQAVSDLFSDSISVKSVLFTRYLHGGNIDI